MDIISLEEFEALSEEEQKQLLQELKEEMGTTALIKHWDISRTKMYNMIHQLGVPVQPKKRRTSLGSPPSLHLSSAKFGITMNETSQGKVIADRLIKLAKLLEEEDSSFIIRLDLREE